MELKDQVCNLELAKKLKTLGVKQESIFVWEYYDGQCYAVKFIAYAIVPDNFNKFQLYSAFTVAELGKLLPGLIKRDGIRFYITMDCDKNIFYEDMTRTKQIYASFDDDNEADCRAKMLLYLIENNLIEIEK
jgi:hypothetical protein